MRRITTTIEQELPATVDTVMRRRRYASRSEAIPDMFRDAAGREAVTAAATTWGVAAPSGN